MKILIKKLFMLPVILVGLISPLSISCALSMALNGANGSTRDAMPEALRIEGLTPATINSSYKKLTEALLNVDKRVVVSIANSV